MHKCGCDSNGQKKKKGGVMSNTTNFTTKILQIICQLLNK